ncbi:hypothetical protein T484DRAFT_1946212 [Baffinella frigidus]|nr:hypothetical protein T484DRAFT_1946212 [Cryptophyta sp. CCMP2293]|mmetsp:Transcript_64738/g.154571  ORF Transcript_64738/g.154571 Transcript_64738/m.154571 type:complete len:199 (+) Transcript_64738:8-604(+)
MRLLAMALGMLSQGGTGGGRFLSSSEAGALLCARAPVLFLGNGPRTQYADVDAVMTSLQAPLEKLSAELGEWVAVFGGDSYVESAPDLGAVMKRVQQLHGVPLLAVVGWEDVDAHVDLAYRYSSQTCGKTGRELYGGFDDEGQPVAGTSVYLSEWLPQLQAVVAVEPRGTVGRAELAYARGVEGLTVLEVPAVPRFQP